MLFSFKNRVWMCCAVVWMMLCTSVALANPALPAAVLRDGTTWRLQGQARLTYFGFKVYDARLWVSPNWRRDAWQQQPLVLDLTYLRGLKGQAIAERSLTEMRRQGPVADADAQRWLAFLQKALPDVANGSRLIGLYQPGVGSRFYLGDKELANTPDDAFGQRFFGIWLSTASSQPAMRDALLGGKP